MKLIAIISLVIFILISAFEKKQCYADTTYVYRAKNAVLSNAEIENEHFGYNGDGYINFENMIGSSAEWNVNFITADSGEISIRYANGSENIRFMRIEINNIPQHDSISFIPTGSWSQWKDLKLKADFSAAENSFKIISIESDGGPNIDEIKISGNLDEIKYRLSIKTIGDGFVEINHDDSLFTEGSSVELTAIAREGSKFMKWLGGLNGNRNPIKINMDEDIQISALFAGEKDTSFVLENIPIGFASMNVYGQHGTYGGNGGDTLVIKTSNDLYSILTERKDPRFEKNHPPLCLLVDGEITWTEDEMMDIKETYDLSIIGMGSRAIINGFGFNIFRSHNIIIRNIDFRNAPDDAINITNNLSHHIWIDHCTFSDTPDIDPNADRHDGLLDIKDGASYVTVSWNRFYNHRKTSLVGHSDNNGNDDIGNLKVTYHHNWFDNSGSRNPRVRFGQVHLFNNYYDNSSGTLEYGIASTMDADVLAENNYFYQVDHPLLSGYAASDPGDIVERNNIFESCGEPEIFGDSFYPEHYYNYIMDSPNNVPVKVVRYSGHGKMDIVNSIKSLENSSPIGFELHQNYPNPFNPTTIIEYYIPYREKEHALFVKMSVFDVIGCKIKTLVNEKKVPGSYKVRFESADLSSGIYIYKLEVGKYSASKKMVLIK